jgi:hypothetical protein
MNYRELEMLSNACLVTIQNVGGCVIELELHTKLGIENKWLDVRSSLYQRELIQTRGPWLRLTDKGKEIADRIINKLKEKGSSVDKYVYHSYVTPLTK